MLFILFSKLAGSAQTKSTYSKAFDSSRVLWESLAFKGKNFWGTAITKVRLEEMQSADAEELLINSTEGRGVMPKGQKVLVVNVSSTITPLFGSDDYFETKVWFTSEKATALQRDRLRLGRKKWHKAYRFLENGVYRLRKEPNSLIEKKMPKERWTKKVDSFYSYNLEKRGCTDVSEPLILFFYVSAANLYLDDEPKNICVFYKKQLHRIQIQAEKSQLLNVKFTEQLLSNKTLRKGDLEVLKISCKPRPLVKDKDKAEPFSFLKLKGEFDIYIEKSTRIPVQVSGRIPKFGKVDIKLFKVEMNSTNN